MRFLTYADLAPGDLAEPVDESKLPAAPEPEAGDARPIRYLHPSRPDFLLLDKPLSLYVAFDGAPPEQEAEFLSYQQLLETVEVPPGRPVTFRDFLGFFERHRQKIKFADAHQAFEELRGVLTSEPEGPFTREACLALGVRQSMFNVEQRAALYELFERYRAWLEDAKLYEPNLIAHRDLARMQPVYDFVAVDEVQDLTNVQLALVLRVLDVSDRNSDAITRVANGVLKLKHARFGSIDRESNQLMRAVAGERGTVSTFQAGTRAVSELDERTRQSTRVAVIVLREEHKFFVNALYVALTRAVKEAYLVEDDVQHPLVRLLGVAASDSAADVKSERASSEEWQKEAHRLEAQGKREQADAILARFDVLYGFFGGRVEGVGGSLRSHRVEHESCSSRKTMTVTEVLT